MAVLQILDSAIVHERDYFYTYFGLKTLERSYLLQINGELAERPQHMLMRVALGIHGEDIEAALEVWLIMSNLIELLGVLFLYTMQYDVKFYAYE